MPIDAIVRVSFESSPKANLAVDKALAGDPATRGPFEKIATAAYSCHSGDDAAVGRALGDFGAVLSDYAAVIDSVSISLVRRAEPGRQWSELR